MRQPETDLKPAFSLAGLGRLDQLRVVKHQLDQRADTEHVQVATRLTIFVFLILFGSVLTLFDLIPGGLSNPIFLIPPILLILHAVQIIWIFKSPSVNHLRRGCSIIVDAAATAIAIHLAGPWGISLGFVFVIIIISSGQHFGHKYLVFSSVVSQLAVLGILVFTPYMRAYLPAVIVGFIVLTIIPIFYKALNKRLDKALSEQKILVTHSIHAEESRRQTYAADLHNKVQQDLVELRIGMALIDSYAHEAELSNVNTEKINQISNRVRMMDQNLENMQAKLSNILQYLWPETLDELGLPDALKEMIDRLEQMSNEPVWSFASNPGFAPNLQRDICLYRIAQESTTNISRHAQATRATVRLGRRPIGNNKWSDDILEISDNGIGVDTENLKHGIGISGMHQRAKLADGTLEIKSLLGRGTTIRVNIPWRNDAMNDSNTTDNKPRME